MFNSFIKTVFIKHQYKKAYKDAISTFDRISIMEETYNKDIAEFSKSEIIQTLISIKAPTIDALAKVKSTITQYTVWASENKYFPQNDSIYQISRTELLKYLDSNAIVNGYIKSRDELYDVCKKLKNPVDQAILVLLFEGLNGDGMKEIRLLKKEDINFNDRQILIRGTSKRYITNVDTRSLDILKKAIETDDYDNKNGRSNARAPKRYMISSDYVIRPTKMHNTDGSPISTDGINVKFKNIKIETGKFYINSTKTFYSGIYNTLLELESYQKLSIPTYKRVLNDCGMKENIYPHLREGYETYKFYKSVELCTPLTQIEMGLRGVSLEEIAKYTPNSSDKKNQKDSDISAPDQKDRTKEHQELVYIFASLLYKNAYKLYERPVDCLGIKSNCISILCEAKTLNGTYNDEVEQVRRCLSQLLYYNMLKVDGITNGSKTQNVALFNRKIRNSDHIAFLQNFGCLVIWYEGNVLKGTDEALLFLRDQNLLL